jgi:nicotinamidase-related amidase
VSNALIVVDMQRGFMAPGGTLYCGDAARAIIPPVRLLIESEAGRGALVIFTADTHAPDDKEFAMFPPHCVAGTPEVEIIPELADLAAQHAVLPKRRYSAFFDTDLGEQLAAFGPEQIIVVGDCTDICVLHTVADARNRDYPVWVPSNCVASFDPDAHAWALRHIKGILGARTDPTGSKE